MKVRYAVRRMIDAWIVLDKATGATMCHFHSRNKARAHAKQLNELNDSPREILAGLVA